MLTRAVLLTMLVVASAVAGPEEVKKATAEPDEAFGKKDFGKAIAAYTTALEQGAPSASNYVNRASSYSSLGKLEEALKDYASAEQLLAKNLDATAKKHMAVLRFNRGLSLERAKRLTEALAEYEQALLLDPEYPGPHEYAAWILATHADAKLRNPPKALIYAMEELKINPQPKADVLDTLAAAYAAAEKYEKAAEIQQQAIAKETNSQTKQEFIQRLSLYQQNKPYVQLAE